MDHFAAPAWAREDGMRSNGQRQADSFHANKTIKKNDLDAINLLHPLKLFRSVGQVVGFNRFPLIGLADVF